MLSFIRCPCPPQPFLCGYLSAETFSLNIFDYFANLWTFFLTFKKNLKIHSILKKFLISPSPQSEQRILTVRAAGGVEKRPAPFTGFRVFGAQHAGLTSGRVLGGRGDAFVSCQCRMRISSRAGARLRHTHARLGEAPRPFRRDGRRKLGPGCALAPAGSSSGTCQSCSHLIGPKKSRGSARLQDWHVSVLFTSHWPEKVTW